MIPVAAIDKATWVRLSLLCGVALIVATFLGWQAGEVSVPPAPPLAPTAWALPSQAEENSEKDIADLTARQPWSKGFGTAGADDKKAKEAPAPWRLAGIVERADGNFALIAVGQRNAAKFEYRSVGDTLPDGSRLIDITSEGAVVEVKDSSGEKRVYSLLRGQL